MRSKQVQAYSARNGPIYYQIRPDLVRKVLGRLKSCGYISHDPNLAGIVTRTFLGKDSTDFQALVAAQGEDFEYWTMFACSPDHIERWKRGASVSQQVHLACCKTLEEITGEPFSAEAVSAICPVAYFPEIQAATERLIESTRSSLLDGQMVDHSEDLLHNGYAIGVSVKANVNDITLEAVDAPEPFEEFKIMVRFRGQLLPIGYIIAGGSDDYSILYDPPPFIWQGADIWIGRKLVRLVKFQGGSVNEHITRLLDECLAPEQIAS